MTKKSIYLTELNTSFIVSYLLLVNNLEVHKTTSPSENFTPFTKEKIYEWLSTIQAKEDRADFAIIEKESNSFIGEVVLNHIKDDSANIRIAILPQFFDKGFGTMAMKLSIEHGFKKLKLKKITLGVYEINPRAIKVYTKLGFKETHREKEGAYTSIKMSLFRDNFLYQEKS